jgi:hypothetical protein
MPVFLASGTCMPKGIPIQLNSASGYINTRYSCVVLDKSTKCKHVVLIIKEKSDLISKLEEGSSKEHIFVSYEVGEIMVHEE